MPINELWSYTLNYYVMYRLGRGNSTTVGVQFKLPMVAGVIPVPDPFLTDFPYTPQPPPQSTFLPTVVHRRAVSRLVFGDGWIPDGHTIPTKTTARRDRKGITEIADKLLRT